MIYPIGTIFLHNESGTPFLVKDKDIILNGAAVLAPVFDLMLQSQAFIHLTPWASEEFTIVYPNSTIDTTESI